MSKSSKGLTIAKLNDLVLGAFASAPSSEKLNHLIRFLSTWSGSDKLFMVIQFAIKIIIPYLNLRARIQHSAGLRAKAVSTSATSLARFESLLSDSRMLWRLWGLLPIYQWLTSLEKRPPPTRGLLTIERLQGWSLLIYYPLEHLFYLRVHSLLPETFSVPFFKSVSLDTRTLGMWSTRFWAAYVFLQFVHLAEDRRLLKLREKVLKKDKGKGLASEDKSSDLAEISNRWDALYNELIVNIGYLPLTIHWSLKDGLFKNDLWIGIFGLIAGVASFRSGWNATALPGQPKRTSDSEPGEQEKPIEPVRN